MTDLALAPLLRRHVDSGDAEAMRDFVARTRPRLMAVARRIGAPQDAADSVQEAYYALLRRQSAELGAPIFPWLLTAVVRIAYQRKATQRRQHRIAERLSIERESRERPSRVEVGEEIALVRREVSDLPARYRDAIVLHHLEGLSTREVAEMLEIPRSTVKTRLQRGRFLLRGRLAPRIALALLALPWLARDTANALAAGAVSSKAAVVGGVAALLLTFGIYRFYVAGDETALPAERAAPTLVAAEAPPVPPTTPAAPTPAPAVAAAPAPKPEEPVSPAARLRVSKSALQAAIDADGALALPRTSIHRGKAEAAVTVLQRYGDEAFRAVLVLLRDRTGGERAERLLAATMQEGRDYTDTLIEFIEDETAAAAGRMAAIEALRLNLSPRVREWLVQRLPLEQSTGVFYRLAGVAGAMNEPRASAEIAVRFLAGYNTAVDAHLAVALGGTGGPEAIDALVRYIDTPGREAFLYATFALEKLDPERAREKAIELLDSDRAPSFSKLEKRHLTRLAGTNER